MRDAWLKGGLMDRSAPLSFWDNLSSEGDKAARPADAAVLVWAQAWMWFSKESPSQCWKVSEEPAVT